MSERFSEEAALSAVVKLTRVRLTELRAARIVTPVEDSQGAHYAAADLARLELCCELIDTFDLEGESLGMVMDLLDELHGLRGDLRALLGALGEEAEETRLRVQRRAETLRG